MKILYVDLEREWRGGQSQALLTLRGLQEKKHDVALIAARRSPLAKRASEAGIMVREVARLGLRAWGARAIAELIANGRFDVVHLNEPHALTSAWMARAQERVPLLLSRRIGFPLRRARVSKARYRAVERFVANSIDVARSLVESGIAPGRISIVNEGVEIPPRATLAERTRARQHWRLNEGDFVFGCASVFVREKGQRHVIDALAKVRKTHPQARLLLAGSGPLLSEMANLTKQLGQMGAVLLPGFVENVREVYAALDAFVFPSEFEGLGTALQAAMAAGLPCVSTARGALGEVVEHERTALVAEPSGDGFTNAMLRLLNDTDLRTRLGEAGRREVECRFSADLMVENTLLVYEDVLAKRSRA
ncbi:MAG: glycosyltransferase family 4 protein [Candidatus Acidiferrum sp.]